MIESRRAAGVCRRDHRVWQARAVSTHGDRRRVPLHRRRRAGRPAARAAAERRLTRRSAGCWCAARRAPPSRPPCARWPRCCPRSTSSPAAGSRCDPAAPDPACPDGPHEAGPGATPAGADGRAARRRLRGPARRLARHRAGAGRGREGLRAGAARRRAPRRSSTSTRSTCSTTTSSTCCSTPPRWARRTSSARASPYGTRPGSCWSAR